MTLPVRIIPGGLHRDERGAVRHVNGFDFRRVDRFYTVYPARPGETRGWVGHRQDWKWFFAIKGSFMLGVVQPADWGRPSRVERVKALRLDSESPRIIEVPPGSYTANRALTDDAILLIFSSGKIETAPEDDFRLPVDYWTLAT